jgi:hypothetical protein
VRRIALLLAAAALTGCGGAKTHTTTTVAAPAPAAAMHALIATDPSLAGTVRTLFQDSSWAVVQSTSPGKASAVAFRLVDGRWRADRSGVVRVSILGPEPGATAPVIPQVAIAIKSKQAFVQDALWIDGKELFEKGGGSPNDFSAYGAPTAALKEGPHVAVGFARTDAHATAIAWVFKVG